MAGQSFDEHTPRQDFYNIENADGTAPKGIYTGGGAGTRYDALTVSSDDTVDHTAEFYLSTGGAPVYLGSVVVLAGAGHAGVPAVDALAALAVGTTNGVLMLSGIAFAWRVTVAMTAGKFLALMAVGGDF